MRPASHVGQPKWDVLMHRYGIPVPENPGNLTRGADVIAGVRAPLHCDNPEGDQAPLESHERLARAIAGVLEESLVDPTTITTPSEIWVASGRKAASKRRIYLDKNVWIWLRDVELGRAREPVHQRLSDGLRALVESGTHLCPASDITLLETLRQKDERTRIATAKVIDRLCGGLALAPYTRRREVEFFRWILSTLAPDFALRPAVEAAWVPVFHVVEPVVPHSDDLHPKLLRALQHAFLSASSEMEFADAVTWLGPLDPSLGGVREEDFAGQMTDRIVERTDRGWTYDDVFAIEFRAGVVSSDEALSSAIRSAGIVLHGVDGGPAPSSVIEQYANIAVGLYDSGTLGDALPTLQVAAAHPAMIRLDPLRKYKKGDRMDSMHAAGALPYYDALFTDSSLRHLLTIPPASLASRFECKVVSGAAAMAAFVEDELAESA